MRGFYGKLQAEQEQETIKINEGFKQFQTYNIARNLSPRSIEYYQDTIERFLQFYDGEKTCDTITPNTIFEYIAYMRQHCNIKDITVNTRLRSVRAMCYYFMKMGYMPRFQIELIRAKKEIKETYTDNELAILLEKPKISQTTFAEYRNWVVINYLMATGNRVSTICNLKVKDIDFNDGVVILRRTKNRREQVIPLSKTIRAILKEYLKYRKGTPDDYLFCSVNGDKLEESGLRIGIRKYNHKRGITKTSIHLFRHTFAKKWILNGGDVFRLQKVLGHSSMEIVREYVNMFGDDLKRDFDMFNPLEELSNKRGEFINTRSDLKKKRQRIAL
jgi:integrase/recombinase XerD